MPKHNIFWILSEYFNSLFQSFDVKKERFRKLVERSGIIETVTKALTELYEEQIQEGDNALELFRKKICISSDEHLVLANSRIRELEAELALRPKIEQSQ